METLIFELLGDAAKSSVTEKITVFMVAWFFVKRAMVEHLGKVESSLKQVSDSVTRMENTLTSVRENHESKIERLEEVFDDLQKQVEDLQNKKDA